MREKKGVSNRVVGVFLNQNAIRRDSSLHQILCLRYGFHNWKSAGVHRRRPMRRPRAQHHDEAAVVKLKGEV